VLLRAHRSHQPATRAGWRQPRGVSTSGPPAAITLRGVTVQREGVPVLRGIDWRVDIGDRWVILGPNGSGKTTLLQVASARLWPTSGSVAVLGAHLGHVDVRTLRPRVALVSGAVTRQLRANLPARDVVASGRHGALETWWNRYTTEDWERADELLARGGVGEIGDRPFGVISEGERQQVLLARALMSDPELILLDEPFAGLDLGARERLLVRLTALATDPGSPPIVLVTHHCEEIPPGFTHGALMSGGALVASGRLRDVVTSARVSACFAVAVTVGCTDGRWWSRAV
jgi:iron complex transport system ATP-binding protein